MRLQAKVKGTTGKTRHSLGTVIDGNLKPVEDIPTPSWLEIVQEDGAFYLFYFNECGVCFTDTWHQSLEEAKQQAAFEFGIEAGEWTEVRASN